MCLNRGAVLLAVVLSLGLFRAANAFDEKDKKDDKKEQKADAPPKPLDAKQLEAMWADLADGDAAKAYVAICALAERPAQAVTLFAKHLKPVPAPDAQKIATLIKDLDSGRFPEREKAMKELRRIGVLAAPALREARKNKPTLEAAKRMDELLSALEGPVTDPETLRAVRSAETLERIATKEAKELMRKLAKGAAGARLTQECQDSLRRLDQRP
jgi:hypothetical protein